MTFTSLPTTGVIVRPVRKSELSVADHVIRVAFGTAAGAPNPEMFFGDADTVRNRWKADDTAVFVAESNEEIVAANVVTQWGSFGFFGPFGVWPDLWNRGIATKIVASVMDWLGERQIRLTGLYTEPGSPKHIRLYQQFGFRPQYLTAVMIKSLGTEPDPDSPPNVERFGELGKSEQAECLSACRHLTDSIFDGLDLTTEIEAIEKNRLGDTLLLQDRSKLTGFAVCHLGTGTEAGGDTCYVKFAAALNDGAPPHSFEKLLSACEAHARAKGVTKLVAGVNTSRREAYEKMLRYGFQTRQLGVAMLKPDIAGFNRPGVFVMDDWR